MKPLLNIINIPSWNRKERFRGVLESLLLAPAPGGCSLEEPLVSTVPTRRMGIESPFRMALLMHP